MSTTTSGAQDQIKAVRDQLQQARRDRAEAEREVVAAREAWQGVDTTGQKITDLPEFHAAELAIQRRGEISDRIAELERAEHGFLALFDDSSSASHYSQAGGVLDQPLGRLSGHQLLAVSEDYQRAREMGMFGSQSRFGTVHLGEIMSRDSFAAAPSQLAAGTGGPLPPAAGGPVSTPAWQNIVPPDIRGVVPPPLLRLTMLDLIPLGTTDSNIVQYVQLTGLPLSAAETAELANKLPSGITGVDVQATVKTIASYIKMSRQSLDDVAGLGSLINTLMPYNVRRRLELQMLVGDGAGQNLTGIYNTTGVSAPTYQATDIALDAIRRAMTSVVISDCNPNFCAINPIDLQTLLMEKAQTAGLYLFGNPASTTQPPTIWGLNIVESRLIPVGAPLIGDAMGATLLFREGVNVKVSDADQDDFISNRITLLAECRAAFPVWIPRAFAIASLGAQQPPATTPPYPDAPPTLPSP
jgi:HK97 family phage major capsid protein